MYLSNGEEPKPSVKFLAPGANVTGVAVVDGVVYASTAGKCGGSTDGISALTLESGTVTNFAVTPVGTDGFSFGLMAISDDQGKTWHASEPIVGFGNIQPSVVRRKNGDLVAFMRDNRAATVKSIARTTNYAEKIIDLSYDTEMQMISFDGAFSAKALDFLRNSFQELEILDFVPPVKDSRTSNPAAFGSGHVAGWNVAYADGMVRTVSFSIDPTLHAALSGRDDGPGVIAIPPK